MSYRCVKHASKALTYGQLNYKDIERECLAIVYGITCFYHCIYEQHFTIMSAHSPLEIMIHKPIHIATLRLQHMIENIGIQLPYI